MEITFEHMSDEHRTDIIDIYNYYAENSFSAYLDTKIPYEYYDKFIKMTENYPAFAIKAESKVIGFCFLHAYKPLPAFNSTAEITYFLDKDYRGRGIGRLALAKLESEARHKGIQSILANIASLNEESLAFHSKNGFRECGRFERVIKKKDKVFDVVWMQKMII